MGSNRWYRPVLAALVAAAVLVAACGGGSGDTNDDADDAAQRVVRLEPASSTGPDPFTASVAGEVAPVDAPAPTDGAVVAANAPGLYGGTGDPSVCDQEQLVAFLEENPDKAAAWAGALGIEPGAIATYVATLTPAVLQHDAQVTNHGFADGRATPRQSVLEAGTTVLVDAVGVPRTRCACGNPLLEPQPVADPVYEGDPWPGWEPPPIAIVAPPPTGEPVAGFSSAPTGTDFCTVYEDGRPTVEGGPSGPDDVLPYVARLEVYFADLIAAAEATPGFPPDALADLEAYHADLVAAVEAGDPSAIAGSTELRDRNEAFLESFCADPPANEPTTPPVLVPDGAVPNAQCGSMMFYLLVSTAEGLGVEWEATAQPFLDEMDAILATPELADMIPYEEAGCEGAQAVYDLLVDAGYGDAIEGSDLDPYA